MKCPYCGNIDTRVIDSRPADDGTTIRRRRSCDACNKRFTTYEKVETIPLIVIKKDNNREQYDRTKLEGEIKAFQEKANAFTQDSRRREAEEMNKLVAKVQAAVKTVADKEGYSVVIKADAAFYAADENNITEKVLAQVK